MPLALRNLDLRRNMIGDIDALLTSIMPNLKTAYFDYNKISSIPDFSTSKSMIKELVFRNNRIVQIAPTAFKSFKEMSRLDLSNNNIRHLNETAFSANSRLESLILNWNRLTTVTGVFNRTPQIRHLRLSFNQIRNITAAFNGLTKLRSLSIRNNLLTCIPDDTFRDNRGLQKVTLNENDIQWIGRDAFQGLDKLKIITLRNNRLLTLNNSMRNLPKLQYIDASFNAIQGLETGEFARNINLAAVLLAGNNISSVKGAFVAATYLRMLKIDGNRLLLISRGDFAPKMRSKPSLIINNNPLMCDCRLAWLVHNNSQVRLKEQFTCMGPRWLQGKSMLSLTEDDLVGWEDDCESGCHCRCKEDPSGVRVMTVDCSKAKLGHFPKRLPGNTTALYLQDNGLVLLDDRLKRKAPRLQLLSLRNNRLTDFNVSAVPTTVTSLDLRGNRLKQLPYSLVTEHTFTFLWLSDNPFRCDCADYNFSQWIQAHGEVVRDAREIRCGRSSNPAVSGKQFVSLGQKQLCPASMPKGTLFLLLVLGLLVIILTLLAIYLRYGRAAKLWARTLGVCGWTPCTEEQDLYLEKLLDVFVSFSSKDTSWVNDELLPRLDILGLSYCTYERNFKGDFLLQDIIRDAIACSRRTLLLITRNFVESEWCRWEFRLAHQRALDDINRLVIVLVDEEAAGALDGDLRLYVRAANHLRWGEPNFWERLQRSLPNNGAHRKVITEEPLSTRMTGTGGTELSKITAKKLQYQYSQDNITEKEVVVG
ncbi:protein toll-like [Amblyomma americanum]